MGNTTDRIQHPVIGLSSSNGETLIDEYISAVDAIDQAMKALAVVSPHSRDYQMPHQSFPKAVVEAESRRARLQAVRNELMDIAWSLTDQVTARR